MDLYTQRHGMRKPVQKTYEINIRAYAILFDCCTRYYDHIAWKFPEECPDGNGCCGLDFEKFNNEMLFEIPSLYRFNGEIAKPNQYSEYDQFALIDLIEFFANNMHDINLRKRHDYYNHDDLSFLETTNIVGKFIIDVNSIFEKTGLLYVLNKKLQVERIEETPVLNSKIVEEIETIKEEGLKDLLQNAITKHLSPYPEDQKDAVEKIWDALERLKTYYGDLNKKQSVEKIIQDMSNKNQVYVDLFNSEFKELTNIGNDFRIRHHETDKYEIPDLSYYDYFFNRCLSLISTTIKFLK